MKAYLLAIISVGSLFSLSSASQDLKKDSETKCFWVDRINAEEVVSSFTHLTSVHDCVNGLGISLMAALHDQGDTTYDGQFILSDSREVFLGSCFSKTLQPASEEVRGEILSWLRNHRKDYSRESFIELLRGQEWQDRIKSHMYIQCQALPPAK